jgi:ribosomal protein S18 acetylase RimI-like enzyme
MKIINSFKYKDFIVFKIFNEKWLISSNETYVYLIKKDNILKIEKNRYLDWVCYLRFDIENSDQIYIQTIETDEKYQKQGLATLLIKELFNDYKDFKFRLSPICDKDIFKWYKRLGFKICDSWKTTHKTKKSGHNWWWGFDMIKKTF